MKSDLQIKIEADDDLESLKTGRAHYSTPAQDAAILLAVSLAVLAEVLLIGWGVRWLVR